MNTLQMYDAQADSINVDDIATDATNRIVLRRIRSNEKMIDDDGCEISKDLYIQNEHDDDGEECVDYVPESAYDMGWLGYFIGNSDRIEDLHLSAFTPTSDASVTEVLEPFFKGLSGNKSITTLDFGSMDLLGGRVFSMMGRFFENSCSLANLKIHRCHLGDDGWHLLALAIGSSKNKSLRIVSLKNNNISDEGMVDIITSLSMHPRLEQIDLSGNRLNKNGCMTLSIFLRCSATDLWDLDLGDNEINDEGIDALVPTLKNCNHLESLGFTGNHSITSRGWQHLASILEAPNSSLTRFGMSHSNNLDDEIISALTKSLVKNCRLRNLYIGEILPSTSKLLAFSKLLCDKSSINSTYLSNHALNYLEHMNISRGHSLQHLLTLNRRNDKKEVAMIKILKYHNDFDMVPFFEWEFKVLPLIIDWFERASSINMPYFIIINVKRTFEPNIGPRKLSSIYQFVRGMPLLYVETRIRKEFEDIKALESQMEEEQFLMRQEQLMLDLKLQRLRQRKQSVKDHKESLLEKLAR